MQLSNAMLKKNKVESVLLHRSDIETQFLQNYAHTHLWIYFSITVTSSTATADQLAYRQEYS